MMNVRQLQLERMLLGSGHAFFQYVHAMQLQLERMHSRKRACSLSVCACNATSA